MAKKVMIVDDSRTIRQHVHGILSAAGYEVLEASDGIEAIQLVASTPSLSLLICDVNMPRMNGIELVGLLKDRPANANLTIVMLTTEGQPELIAKAKAAGARGWMVKPFKPDLLLATVRRYAGSA